MSLLESLKNSLVGKVHMPHSPLIDHGIHALTFEGIFSNATQKATAKSSSQSQDFKSLESDRIRRLMALIERLLRVYDQVDEQLHAGWFFYILTGGQRFVSNSVFVYPVVIIILGYFLPSILDYYDHYDMVKENETADKVPDKEGDKVTEPKANPVKQMKMGAEVKLICLIYCLGLLFVVMPVLVL